MNTEVISIVLNFILGGGFLIFVTIKAAKKKAEGEASQSVAQAKVIEAQAGVEQGNIKTKELDNVQEAISIWREMAESLKAERDEYKTSYVEVQKHNAEMAIQIEAINKKLTRLANINDKIVKQLDKITPENLEQMVDQIKKLHENI